MAQIQNPRSFVCTPSSLLASSPCLGCLSETEMLATMVGIISLAVEKTIPAIMQGSACFGCMSKKDMLQALVTILGNDLIGENFTEQQILDQIKCVRQCSNEKQLLAALLYLLCNDVKFTTRLILL